MTPGLASSHPEEPRARPQASALGMGLFLAALTVFFAASLLAFGIVRARTGSWLPENASFPAGLWLSTFLILLSSVTMRWSVAAAREARYRELKVALWATLALGLFFLASQSFVWVHLWAERIAAKRNLNFFYMITGLHALHVLGGLAALALMGWRSLKGWARHPWPPVRLTAYYWHFLDVVWLIMLAVLILCA